MFSAEDAVLYGLRESLRENFLGTPTKEPIFVFPVCGETIMYLYENYNLLNRIIFNFYEFQGIFASPERITMRRYVEV